jgi:hypothetical protein
MGKMEYPLILWVFFCPTCPLDWAWDGEEDEDLSLAILDAMEEDFHRETKVVRPKSKGRRELLNLKSSINYGNANESSRRWKGKTHLM